MKRPLRMDYSKKSLSELKELCKASGMKGITGKKKSELLEYLQQQQEQQQKQKPSYRILSLFSGAGGDSLGFEQAGHRVTHFSENKKVAIETHKAAFPTSQLLVGEKQASDIRKIPDKTFEDLKGNIDIIFAGFPCQGFSHAGKKKTDDPRNELVHEFVRAVKLIQPQFCIGENVKGLLSRKGIYPPNTAARPVIHIISELFEKIGYKLSYQVIDTVRVGVPQLRKRLIMIAHKGEQYPQIPWDSFVAPTPPPSIRSLLSPTLYGAMELPAKYNPAQQSPHFWIPTEETVVTGEPHTNLQRLVKGIRNLSTKEKEAQNIPKETTVQFTEPGGLISFGTRQGGYHGQILDPDKPSKTIICTYNLCPRLFVGLHNKTTNTYYIRCLTVEECGQIQGFPKDYPWQGTDKEKIVQIGNAVPPPLSQAIVNILDKITFSNTPQTQTEENQTDSENEEDEE